MKDFIAPLRRNVIAHSWLVTAAALAFILAVGGLVDFPAAVAGESTIANVVNAGLHKAGFLIVTVLAPIWAGLAFNLATKAASRYTRPPLNMNTFQLLLQVILLIFCALFALDLTAFTDMVVEPFLTMIFASMAAVAVAFAKADDDPEPSDEGHDQKAKDQSTVDQAIK